MFDMINHRTTPYLEQHYYKFGRYSELGGIEFFVVCGMSDQSITSVEISLTELYDPQILNKSALALFQYDLRCIMPSFKRGCCGQG